VNPGSSISQLRRHQRTVGRAEFVEEHVADLIVEVAEHECSPLPVTMTLTEP